MQKRLFLLISRVSFPLVILFMFLLPFVTITCQNQEVLKATGMQLATGDVKPKEKFDANKLLADIDESSEKENIKSEKGSSNPIAIAIIVSVLLGFATSFWNNEKQKTFILSFASLTLLLLFVLAYTIDSSFSNMSKEIDFEKSEYAKQVLNMFKIEMGIGYYFSVLVMILIFIVPGYQFVNEEEQYFNEEE